MTSAIAGGILALDQLLKQSQELAHVQENQAALQQIKIVLLERNFQISQNVLLSRYQVLYDFVNKQEDKLNQALLSYAQREGAGIDKKFLADLEQVKNNLNTQVGLMAENLRLGQPEEAVLILQNEFNTELNQFNRLLTQMINQLDPLVNEQKQAAANTSSSSKSFLLFSGAGAALVAIFLAIVLVILVTRRVKRLGRAVSALGRGDLDVRVAHPSRDELGQVGQAFNQMADTLTDLLTSIEGKRKVGQAAGNQVSVIVGQLSSMASNQSQIAAEQAGIVSQLTSNLEELAHTVRQIAERASDVANSANFTLGSATYLKKITVETSQAGQLSLERSNQSTVLISQVETQLNSARRLLGQLIKQSNSIEKFVELIRAIADETHLIALNGAIEAAGTGEAGERFGVIATAVRDLATRTKSATALVAQDVEEIRSSVRQLEVAVEETASSSQASVHLSLETDASIKQLSQFTQETEEQFNQIVQAMAAVVELSSQIKASTSQQDSASVQLTTTMRELNNISRVVADSSQELAQTTYQLQDVSHNMLEKLAS